MILGATAFFNLNLWHFIAVNIKKKELNIMFRSYIPNIITLLNLLSGALAVYFAMQGKLVWAAGIILAGAIFDFFDGFAARLLKAGSPIGAQLDSLADLITFGMAPAFMLVHVLQLGLPVCDQSNTILQQAAPFFPFLLVAFSALRLAKFNVDDSQTTDFKGLPTPANALFQVSFAFLLMLYPEFIRIWFVYPVILFFSILMVSPVSLFGLKKWQGSRLIYSGLLLLWSVVAIILFQYTAGVYIIMVYILLSGIQQMLNYKGK
jgi:CDP-diacylglycerol--serine O-phosphatidyltransferase